eukprot:gene11789-biopygen7249
MSALPVGGEPKYEWMLATMDLVGGGGRSWRALTGYHIGGGANAWWGGTSLSPPPRVFDGEWVLIVRIQLSARWEDVPHPQGPLSGRWGALRGYGGWDHRDGRHPQQRGEHADCCAKQQCS